MRIAWSEGHAIWKRNVGSVILIRFFFLPQTRRSYLLCGVVTSEFFFSRMDNYPAGSMNFFCIFGALNAGYICDMVGRRRTFSISCVIFITGILIQVRVRSISYL